MRGYADATVIVTPTDHATATHCRRADCTGATSLPGEATYGRRLNRISNSPPSLTPPIPTLSCWAFQRRFDPPLLYARELVNRGAIGRIFKIYSAMEDSFPAPNGFQSPGILPDMSIHNVDEILWLTGKMPHAALMIGSRIYSHRLTTCVEDFDDAQLYLWFEEELMAELQVGRNHVAGYRTETIIYGEEGEIQVGCFQQNPLEVVVKAFGRRGRTEPIAQRSFAMRAYGPSVPEFAGRFGSAYKAEVAAFVECCQSNHPFPISHWDGVRAQHVIRAGMRSVVKPEPVTPVR
jgi:myo-inositol 2-dehydrogenase/D-chiro-inositol 1-dehydrogenase